MNPTIIYYDIFVNQWPTFLHHTLITFLFTCHKRCLSLSEAALRWPVQFGEGEELHTTESKLPAADILLNIVHPAAIPAHTHTFKQM